MNTETFIKLVTDNIKTKQWLNGTFTVNGADVGIKAYGKWVQRLTVNGVTDGISEQKTNKALASALVTLLKNMGV
jgi:hypothetical protein